MFIKIASININGFNKSQLPKQILSPNTKFISVASKKHIPHKHTNKNTSVINTISLHIPSQTNHTHIHTHTLNTDKHNTSTLIINTKDLHSTPHKIQTYNKIQN